MKAKIFYLIYLTLVVSCFFGSDESCAYGVYSGFGDSGWTTCATPNYNVGTRNDNGNKNCKWLGTSPESGAIVLWGTGQRFRSVLSHSVSASIGLDKAYFPYSGPWKIRMYFCPSTSSGKCTKNRATQQMDTVKSASGNSTQPIASQFLEFGGYSGTLSTSSNACYTFVDSNSNEWTTSVAYMCQGVNSLPNTPATCYLNYGSELNISLGNVERSNIATEPMAGASNNVKKSVSVLCSRDAGTTVSTTFQFTPLTVNGDEVVTTSTANLGVAIFYNGNMVGPSSPAITETFEMGYTDRELEFQAVRNPDVAIKDISTGNFTASAVMVMTEQ